MSFMKSDGLWRVKPDPVRSAVRSGIMIILGMMALMGVLLLIAPDMHLGIKLLITCGVGALVARFTLPKEPTGRPGWRG